jgi:undecaprenyl-diphosphatase
MNIFTALILGIVQGLTEFLPVSSTGHLVLLQKIFDITKPALFFDTMVHVGTLLAVFAVLWKDIWAILRKLWQPLTAYIILATIPAVVFALLFNKKIEAAFESGKFLGPAFLLTSALLVFAELLARRAARSADGGRLKKADAMNWIDALIIGVFQAVAIIPGISRSGATLSGALSRKLERDFAARFSFLLSIPAILGALLMQIKNLVKPDITEAATGSIGAAGIGAGAIIVGTLSAAIVGFFAVKLMLKIVREKSLWGFAIYTGILGLLVLVGQFGTHGVFKP